MIQTTPYFDLHSEDILSAHISALQHNINKLETVLDLITTPKTGQPLNAVADQTDQTLRYKIYEGVDRNWLTSPTPAIYRNGTLVNPSEYTLHAAQGAVVFLNQQLATDAITGDYTMITGNSNILNTLASEISTNTTNISSNAANVSKNISSITGLSLPYAFIIGNYYTHTISAGTFATGVGCGQNNLDAYPFIVPQTAVFDKMRYNISTLSGTKAIMAIYSDNGSGFPGTLLAKTGEIDTSTATGTTGVKEMPFASGDLTLQPGLYWLVKWNDGFIAVNDGLTNSCAISLGDTLDTTKITLPDANIPTNGALIGGIRYTATYGALPSTFPSFTGGSRYLKRGTYPSPWIHRKA